MKGGWGVGGWSFWETWVGGGDDGVGGGDGGGWLVFDVMHGAIITEEGIICCRLE